MVWVCLRGELFPLRDAPALEECQTVSQGRCFLMPGLTLTLTQGLRQADGPAPFSELGRAEMVLSTKSGVSAKISKLKSKSK